MSETVTAEDLRAFLAEYLTPEKAAMSVITPLPASAAAPAEVTPDA